MHGEASNVDEERKHPSLAIALLLIDVINGFNFEGSEALVRSATEAAPKIKALARSARQHGVPVVYVNDNFGMWQSDLSALSEKCLGPDQPGRNVRGQDLDWNALSRAERKRLF